MTPGVAEAEGHSMCALPVTAVVRLELVAAKAGHETKHLGILSRSRTNNQSPELLGKLLNRPRICLDMSEL
jgi:hypothetical protein